METDGDQGSDGGTSRGGGSARVEGPSPEEATEPGSRLWPILIALGLFLVILVNAVFIYIAVSGADQVVPSYTTEER